MSEEDRSSHLPERIGKAVVGVPKGLVPVSLKALDRLVGATIDIPVAWLAQKKAKIDAQTQAFILVEDAIAKTAAAEAGADEATVRQAMSVLVRASYRKQMNRNAVASAMLEDLAEHADQVEIDAPLNPENLDDDWLNVFERYAEDASTERMQKLWGRVLAGEVRKPGQYSMRALRCLSEISQASAAEFSDFCKSVFGDLAPNNLVKPENLRDIRHLLFLESAGLIGGASGIGLTYTLTFNSEGLALIREGELGILLKGIPGSKIEVGVCVLTPLGQELLPLVLGRDIRTTAKAVANAIRAPEIEAAHLAHTAPQNNRWIPFENLWQNG